MSASMAALRQRVELPQHQRAERCTQAARRIPAAVRAVSIKTSSRAAVCMSAIDGSGADASRPRQWGASIMRRLGRAARPKDAPEAARCGGDGGNAPPRAGGGGGGGSGGGSGGDGDAPALAGLDVVRGLRERAAYDKDFFFKLGVEQILGVGASVAGDMAGRPNFGLNELDFVFATLIVGSITNFSLVYMLAPTAATTALKTAGGVLARWGSPQGHMFEKGAYTILQRLGNPAYKGWQFGLVGLFAGVTGTLSSNALLSLRKRFDPKFKLQNEPPKWYMNGAAWGLHLTCSSNLRYQMLNGADMVLQPIMPSAAFKAYTAIIRALNNAVGGTSFVLLAKLIGAQKAAN